MHKDTKEVLVVDKVVCPLCGTVLSKIKSETRNVDRFICSNPQCPRYNKTAINTIVFNK